MKKWSGYSKNEKILMIIIMIVLVSMAVNYKGFVSRLNHGLSKYFVEQKK